MPFSVDGFTVGTLREVLELFDDGLPIMVPDSSRDYDWMKCVTIRKADIAFPEEQDEDGEPTTRECLILEDC